MAEATAKKGSKLAILTKGIIKENPVLVLVLGTCPTLATTSSAETGFGMGLAATAVLICSNIVISALRNIIPDKVRIPCFITIIAGFVTIVQMVLQAYVPSLYSSLGLYLSLIVVNCIILGRAESFASKNSVIDSALDGIGMGLGFTLTLFIMGSIREILGSGTWLAGDWFGLATGFSGIPIISPQMSIMTLVPGGFFTYACVMAAVNFFTKDKSKIRSDFNCEGCVLEGDCLEDLEAVRAKEASERAIEDEKAAAAKKAAAEKAAAAKKAAAEKAAAAKMSAAVAGGSITGSAAKVSAAQNAPEEEAKAKAAAEARARAQAAAAAKKAAAEGEEDKK